MPTFSTLKITLSPTSGLSYELGPRIEASSFEDAESQLQLKGMFDHKVQYEIVFEDEEELEKLTYLDQLCIYSASKTMVLS